MIAKMKEQVLTVPKNSLYLAHFHDRKIIKNPKFVESFLADFNKAKSRFVAREECEGDESLVQPIGYTILRQEGKIYYYLRGNPTDIRLNQKWSLGFGGHVNLRDAHDNGAANTHLVENSMLRELREEIESPYFDSVRGLFAPRAIIYDDSNPVGRVHVGFVNFIDVPAEVYLPFDQQEVKEVRKDLQNTIAKALHEGASWETWSQLVIDAFF